MFSFLKGLNLSIHTYSHASWKKDIGKEVSPLLYIASKCLIFFFSSLHFTKEKAFLDRWWDGTENSYCSAVELILTQKNTKPMGSQHHNEVVKTSKILCFLCNSNTYIHTYSHQVVCDSCDPMDCSLPGSSVHGILWARILEWVAISSSRGSSQCRDQTQVSRIAGKFFTSFTHYELWAKPIYRTFIADELKSDS